MLHPAFLYPPDHIVLANIYKNLLFSYALAAEPVCCMSRDGKSLILRPLPQKEAKQRPMIAIATTEHAGGTA